MFVLLEAIRMGTGKRRAKPDRSRGQGLVEFALILPVTMLLLLITLDFGRLFMSYITLTNETRIAANYGATNPGAFTGTLDTATYDAMVARETAGLNCALQPDAGHNPPIPTYPNGTGLGGSSVATMTCQFSFITPLVTNLFGGPLDISARAEYPIRTGAVANISGTTTLPPPGSPIAAFAFTSVTGGTIDGSGNVSGAGPITVNVTNNSQNAQTYEWDWGDGSPLEFTSVPSTAHQFTSSATVTLTVTNTVGSAFTTRRVTVTPVATQPPVAGFYGTPTDLNPPQVVAGGGPGGAAITGSIRSGVPLVVQFTNQSTNGATDYSWDFGDGSAASTGVSPSHQYSQLGVFSVTLTVTAPTGGTPITRNAYVTTGCLVPNFANTATSNAQAAWDAAGFSGTIYYTSNNPNGGVTTPPSPSQNIDSQSPMSGGSFVPATRVGGAWVCAGDIHLRWK